MALPLCETQRCGKLRRSTSGDGTVTYSCADIPGLVLGEDGPFDDGSDLPRAICLQDSPGGRLPERVRQAPGRNAEHSPGDHN
jgi:hypothetical protein